MDFSNLDVVSHAAPRFPGPDPFRGEGRMTKMEKVRQLGLKVGDLIELPGGIKRRVRRITCNGDVLVKGGGRKPVNVYELVRSD